MKNVYIVLTKSDTVISKIIGLVTKEPFTHASISFDDSLEVMYSFSRYYPCLPLPAGMMQENIRDGFYRHRGHIPCKVLSLQVDDKTFYSAREVCRSMMIRREEYNYSVIGLILCSFSIKREFRHKYFCSQFVSKVLSECCGASLPKPACLMHPADILYIPGVKPVYSGELEDVRGLAPPSFSVFNELYGKAGCA